jgi:predicted ATPase
MPVDVMHTAERHLLRVDWTPGVQRPPDLSAWPFTVPAVKQLIDEGGIEIAPGVTFLVGENGSGKSTLVEALAAIYPRGGFDTPFAHVTGPRASAEDSPLHFHVRARTHKLASPAGFFLRAEAMHGYLADADANESERRGWGGETLQERSHGEAFLAVLRHRFAEPGVYFLDEPEAALSFRSCLGLVSLLGTMRAEGSQVIVATHSPLLVSLPGATLLELGDHGMRRVEAYDDLTLVQDWRAFLATPARYLRHLLDEPTVAD